LAPPPLLSLPLYACIFLSKTSNSTSRSIILAWRNARPIMRRIMGLRLWCRWLPRAHELLPSASAT
jgi:hypothetical protein